jgi:phosphate transport system permease protein
MSATSATPTPSRPHPSRRADRIFAFAASGSGVLILVILAGVAAFLLAEAVPAFTASDAQIPGDKSLIAYLWPLIFGTLYSATLALILAVPLAVGVALFIVYYAPPGIARLLGGLVDLLAAIPSLVFGLWGISKFGPASVGFQRWLGDNLGWLPFFKGPVSPTGRTMMTVAIVLAVMTLPIISALCREAFKQTSGKLEEAAYGLGATRWEMIRMVVLPTNRSAIISASILGLGRALGETMAVTIVLSVSGVVTFNQISSSNPSTIAANIALNFPESSGVAVNILITTGLVLFAITLVVNMLGRWVVTRHEVS